MSAKKGPHWPLSYQRLTEAYNRFYGNEKSPSQIQADINKFWAVAKQNAETRDKVVEDKVADLDAKSLKRKGTLNQFWGNFSKSVNPKTRNNSPASVESQSECDSSSLLSNVAVPSTSNSTTLVEAVPEDAATPSGNSVSATCSQENIARPKQEASRKDIERFQEEFDSLLKVRDIGVLSVDSSKLRTAQTKLTAAKKELKRLQSNMHASRKKRCAIKKKLSMAARIFKENGKCDESRAMQIRDSTGRPRLEEEQPALMDTLIKIACYNAAAADKRRSEELRSCRTLSQLLNLLHDLGFSISRSALYTRLLPKRSNTAEGKRHVKTVPVRLCRAQNDMHKAHPDTSFTVASMKALEEISGILGPGEVAFISQDDKARVPIGLTAATKQAPLLMHVEYRVRLPDHDWVIGAKHKLIPSVYAGCVINGDAMSTDRAPVSYSGPTYIAIRSGKHDSSTSATHAYDLEHMFELPEFSEVVKNEFGAYKPVVFITTDGGPDENPRYAKVILFAISTFKRLNLDALIVATNAPGRSAFNRVERRMAPLSRELAGVILEHDHFGMHLDSQGRTTDINLEKENFKFAGETLPKLWSENLVLDGFPVVADYKEPGCELPLPDPEVLMEPKWYAEHVRESRYMLQIVRCGESTCFGSWRGNWNGTIPGRFLPCPVPIANASFPLQQRAVPNHPSTDYTVYLPLFANLTLGRALIRKRMILHFAGQAPYDWFCPSQGSSVSKRTCRFCGLYFATMKSFQSHLAAIHPKNNRMTKQTEFMGGLTPRMIIDARADEVLVQARSEYGEVEEVEWWTKADIEPDIAEIPVPANTSLKPEGGFPVIDLDDRDVMEDWLITWRPESEL